MDRYRDSVTGLFVSEQFAHEHPNTTTGEFVSTTRSQLAAAKWRVATLETVMRENAAVLRRHSRDLTILAVAADLVRHAENDQSIV